MFRQLLFSFAFMGSAALGRVQASFRARCLATSADRMGYEGSDGLALPRDCWRVFQRRNQRCGLIRPWPFPGAPFRQTADFGVLYLSGCRRCIGCLRVRPTEVCPVQPHQCVHNSQLTRESNLGRLHTTAFCDPHCPGPQGGPTTMMHQDVRGLIERRANHLVAASTDPPIIVNLT